MKSFRSPLLRYSALSVWGITAALAAALVDAGAILGQRRLDKPNAASRGILVENLSGRKCDMFWVNTFKKPEEFVPQFVEDGKSVGLPYGADKSVSSYIGHTFEVREMPSKKTGACVFDECRKVRITVSERFDQKYTIEKDFKVTVRDDKANAYRKADEMFARCQEQAAGITDPLESIEFITRCMEREIDDKIDFDKADRKFHSKVHRHMAEELIPFACADVNKTDTMEIKNTTWSYEGDDRTHTVMTLHKVPTSEIFVVNNFVREETCDALKMYTTTEENEVGVSPDAAQEGTKQSELLVDLYYQLYDILSDRFDNWDELTFMDNWLFRYMKDPVGWKTPFQLCTTQEEVTEVVADMEAGKPKKCLIPGGVPEAVPTDHYVVEDGWTFHGEENKQQRRQLAQLFIFCDEPKQRLGGLHFPFAAVHTTPSKGKLVVAVHRHQDDTSHGFDGYVNEYHLCPNHDVYVHTIYDHRGEGAEGEDEGEL